MSRHFSGAKERINGFADIFDPTELAGADSWALPAAGSRSYIMMATALKEAVRSTRFPLCLKFSTDKANRTNLSGNAD